MFLEAAGIPVSLRENGWTGDLGQGSFFNVTVSRIGGILKTQHSILLSTCHENDAHLIDNSTLTPWERRWGLRVWFS